MSVGNRRNPPAKWTLPDELHPARTICYQIEVPDNIYYRAAFMGALYNLTSARFWQDDLAHTALQVALVWQEIYDNIRRGNCGRDSAFAIGTDGDELMIRQNPTNPCILESSVNGTEWCQWADLSLCVPGGSQPGNGSPQPIPGSCQTYHAQMPANNKWIAPTIVNAGDTVAVANASGASNDGTLSPWRCPNGLTFFAGACVGFGGPEAGDPLLTANHLQLIANIGGTYYALSDGIITVPSGVVNAEIVFQVNDGTLGDNAGSLTFDVTVCNNQSVVTTWCRELDFILSNYSFFGQAPCTVPQGVWVPGSGWGTEDLFNGSQYVRGICISVTLATPIHLTDVDLFLNYAQGTIASGRLAYAVLANSTSLISEYIPAEPQGTGMHAVWHGDMAGVTELTLAMQCSEQSTAIYDGSGLFRGLKLNGQGVAPTIGTVC